MERKRLVSRERWMQGRTPHRFAMLLQNKLLLLLLKLELLLPLSLIELSREKKHLGSDVSPPGNVHMACHTGNTVSSTCFMDPRRPRVPLVPPSA